MVVELVALRRLGAEQRAAGRHEVGTLEVVLLVDQEVLLLRPTVVNTRCAPSSPSSRSARSAAAGQRVHRAQQRDLVVERLAGPRRKRRRDAQQRAVRVLEQERRRRRIPRGVAAGLERRADAAGGEARSVRLALDQLLAGELGDRRAVAGRAVEGVVLLRGRPGERLEPVRVVRRAVLQRPLLHRLGDHVGERRVEFLAARERRPQLRVDVLRQPLALLGRAEHVLAEDLVAGVGEVVRAQGVAVSGPLRRRDVADSGPWHGLSIPPGEGGGCSRAPRRAPDGGIAEAIVVRSRALGITGWRKLAADLSTAGQFRQASKDAPRGVR